MSNTLVDQAWSLHLRLSNAAYSIACVYTRYSWYVKSSETDPRLSRLNDILARSERRLARRAALATAGGR